MSGRSRSYTSGRGASLSPRLSNGSQLSANRVLLTRVFEAETQKETELCCVPVDAAL